MENYNPIKQTKEWAQRFEDAAREFQDGGPTSDPLVNARIESMIEIASDLRKQAKEFENVTG